MKTDPFSDALAFLLGDTPDHVSLGPLRYAFVALFAALLIGQPRDCPGELAAGPGATQRRASLDPAVPRVDGRHVVPGRACGSCRCRCRAACNTGPAQMAENAAYPFYAALVRDLVLPNIARLRPRWSCWRSWGWPRASSSGRQCGRWPRWACCMRWGSGSASIGTPLSGRGNTSSSPSCRGSSPSTRPDGAWGSMRCGAPVAAR